MKMGFGSCCKPADLFSLLIFTAFLFCCSNAFLPLNQRPFKEVSKLQTPNLNAGPKVDDLKVLKNTETAKTATIDVSDATYDLKNGRRVQWKASCKGSKTVIEGSRSLDQYLALPPSEYSVLDANLIQRLNDNEFRCELDPLNFFGNTVIPVLYVRVDVSTDEPKSTISVTKCEITGSEAADKANGVFTVEADNVVTYEKLGSLVRKMKSEVSLRISTALPKSLLLPSSLVERTGNFVLQTSLNLVTNRFVSILAKDYKQWAEGKNDDRKPVE